MQNDKDEYQVPESFLFAPFFSNGKTFKWYDDLTFDEIIREEPFYFDMLFLMKKEFSNLPWVKFEDSVPAVFKQWKKQLPQLQSEFINKKAKSQKESASIQCISLFIIGLFWMNGTSVKGMNVTDMMVSDLKRKPVNCEERLLFIINNPTGYHSFIQLQQLFDELEKIFLKGLALQQLKHKKGAAQ